jgi:hypothetical protein
MVDNYDAEQPFVVTAGIMYAFLGISLATQDYINPSIDIIKKKGVVSASFYLGSPSPFPCSSRLNR